MARVLRSWMYRRRATVLLYPAFADVRWCWNVLEAVQVYRYAAPWPRPFPGAVACPAIVPTEGLALPHELRH